MRRRKQIIVLLLASEACKHMLCNGGVWGCSLGKLLTEKMCILMHFYMCLITFIWLVEQSGSYVFLLHRDPGDRLLIKQYHT